MSWSSIGPFGGLLVQSDPVTQTDGAACAEVYLGSGGGVAFIAANSPGGGWDAGNWEEMDAPGDGWRVAVGHETDRRLVLFVSADSPYYPPAAVWHLTQATAGRANWPYPYQFTAIGGGLGTQLGTPVIGYDVHGAINVFVATSGPDAPGNYLALSTETAAGSGQWSDWQNLGGNVPSAYRPAVGTNWDGRLEVFVRDGAGVQHNWQTTPGGGWHGWASLGTPGPGAASDVAVASDDVQAGSRAGCLEVLVVGSDQHLYQISQTTPGNGWGVWADLGGVGQSFQLSGYLDGPVPATPVIGNNGDGCLEAYLVAEDNAVYRIRQQSPGGPWPGRPLIAALDPEVSIRPQPGPWSSGWVSLDSPGPVLASNPAVGVITENGLLQLFVSGADGNIYNLSQRSNSIW